MAWVSLSLILVFVHLYIFFLGGGGGGGGGSCGTWHASLSWDLLLKLMILRFDLLSTIFKCWNCYYSSFVLHTRWLCMLILYYWEIWQLIVEWMLLDFFGNELFRITCIQFLMEKQFFWHSFGESSFTYKAVYLSFIHMLVLVVG